MIDVPPAGRDSPAPSYFNVKKAAAHLGVSREFVYQRIGRPDGPPFLRRGNRILFPAEEFIAWAAQPVIR